MSAFFGRLEFDGRPVLADPFEAQFAKAQHFGPDKSSAWTDGNLGIGQHLLHVSRFAENEALPGPEQREIIIADAIIDHRCDLCARLGLDREAAAVLSDHDLIRLSFRKWGTDCAAHLDGDYAFAVIHRDSLTVHLFRDAIGTRPLFWSRRGDSLTFGTSIDAILDDSRFNWPISERLIAEYLADPLNPSPEPLYEQVHRVAPGSITTICSDKVSHRKWWNINSYIDEKPRRDTDVLEEAKHLLEAAVRERTDTPQGVGSHFSGGIDSTLISVLAARGLAQSGSKLKRAYSWSPEISDQYPVISRNDERSRILRIAAREGIDVALGKPDHGDDIIRFALRPFEREGLADLVDEIPIMERAASDNVRVMLSGWGGDEAFSMHGEGHFASLALSGRFTHARAFARQSGYGFSRPGRAARSLWQALAYPLLPDFVQSSLTNLNRFTPNYSFASAELIERHRTHIKRNRSPYALTANIKANLARRIIGSHVPMRMETWAAMSARHGFQYRYPLTDRRLIEFLLTLHPDQLVLGNRPRGLSRALLAELCEEQPTKSDLANEQRRRSVREAGWRALAKLASEGGFDNACPWLDRASFLEALKNPLSQDQPRNIMLFYELFTAARVYNLYARMPGQR